MGKTEGPNKNWHGHVTAITVAPEYRHLGLASSMMDLLEQVSDSVHRAYFVDLFVRVSNGVAIEMYERLGYSVYRTVVQYYASESGRDEDAEDGFGSSDHSKYLCGRFVQAADCSLNADMRKPMSRDVNLESVRKNGRSFKVQPEEVWM